MTSITLPNQIFPTTTGEVNLSAVSSEWLIVYFYPKDSTPGCTTQAVDFSALKDQFDALNTTILEFLAIQLKHIKTLRRSKHFVLI